MSTKAGSNPFTQPDFFSPKTTTPNKAYSSSKVVNSSQSLVMTRSSGAFHLPGLTKTQCASSFGSASKQSQTCRKRSSSQIKALKPARKRPRSGMAAEKCDSRLENDRVRRRIITQSVGKPLRQASCPAAIITGLLGGIKGHEPLYQADILHHDISIENILLKDAPLLT